MPPLRGSIFYVFRFPPLTRVGSVIPPACSGLQPVRHWHPGFLKRMVLGTPAQAVDSARLVRFWVAGSIRPLCYFSTEKGQRIKPPRFKAADICFLHAAAPKRHGGEFTPKRRSKSHEKNFDSHHRPGHNAARCRRFNFSPGGRSRTATA